MIKRAAAVMLGLAVSVSAQASHGVAPDQAMAALAKVLAKCESDGYQVAAAIVDPSGVLRAQLRAEEAGPHTIDSSYRKAYTSASLKRPTQAMAELVTKVPSIEGLHHMNEHILLLGGGFPIIIDGKLKGGIGVGGAPGAHLDEVCAREGLKSLGAELFEKKAD